MIVCIEGVDLCGKGIQTKLLQKQLDARVIKFPNRETDTGKMIYAHLDREWSVPTSEKVDATVFQALHTVNRLEQAEEIRRFDGSSKWLVLDRYWPSGVVFGAADGLDEDWLLAIHASLPQPDYFILLDIDLEQVQQRLKRLVETGERKPDRYEADDKVADRIARYRRLWATARPKWYMVNARQQPELVHQEIMGIVQQDRT